MTSGLEVNYTLTPYLNLAPDDVVKWTGRPLAVIDCFGILPDESIRRYFELGCEVKALGRGHIQRIKEAVRARGRAKLTEYNTKGGLQAT